MHSSRFSRVILDAPPFLDFEAAGRAGRTPWLDSDAWPARWILPPAGAEAPFLALFRLEFSLPHPTQLRFHVSAHERYELFFERNGERQLISRGPTRAPAGFRHFESFEAELPAGDGVLLARVSQLGGYAPWAQVSGNCGFLFAVQDDEFWDQFNTGRALWRTRLLNGLSWLSPYEQTGQYMGCGGLENATGESLTPRLWHLGHWEPAPTGVSGNNGFTLYLKPEVPLLRPSPLPAQRSEPWRNLELIGADAGEREAACQPAAAELEAEWTAFWSGESLEVPPHSRRRFWLRSGDYVCAFPTLRGRGGQGAIVRLAWAESLRDADGQPLRLAPFEGAFLRGIGDQIQPLDGEWEWTPSWWRCGLFLRLDIETGDEPLVLEALELQETRYPFEMKGDFADAPPELRAVFEKCLRSLQACAHESYMDCPYYEQLQYLGDTRIQILCSYALFDDDRLARLALWTFSAAARNPSQWMPSSAPSGNGQRIGTFTLWWVEMLHDFLVARGDLEFVREMLPTARNVVELWLRQKHSNGLIELPPGWNYLDAVGELHNLRHPFHGAIQWHFAGVLNQCAALEAAAGEPELAARATRLANEVAQAGEHFWSESRGLFADDLEHTRFSEQTNALALLSGLLNTECRERIASELFDAPENQPEVARASVYFSHYLFEAAKLHGRTEWMQHRLRPWLELEAMGARTTPEHWGRTRSECHAWGAHPLLHFGQ